MLLKASVKTIAVYQLLSAAAFAYGTAWFLLADPVSLLTATIFALLVLFNLFAGIESLRGKRRGYWAGFLNELLQVPSVTVPGFAYDYIGLGQISLLVKSNPQAGDWFVVGVSANLAPGTFFIWFGGASEGAILALDLISAAFAVFLWRILQTHKGPLEQQPMASAQ